VLLVSAAFKNRIRRRTESASATFKLEQGGPLRQNFKLCLPLIQLTESFSWYTLSTNSESPAVVQQAFVIERAGGKF